MAELGSGEGQPEPDDAVLADIVQDGGRSVGSCESGVKQREDKIIYYKDGGRRVGLLFKDTVTTQMKI